MKQLLIVAALALGILHPAMARASDPAAPPAATPTLPSAADLVAPPVLGEPQLSPDGTRVAALGQVRGVPTLILVDVRDAGHRSVPVPLPAGQSLDSFNWAGDRLLVLGLRSADRTRYLVRDIAAGTDVAIRRDGRIIHIDRAGRFMLLSGGDPDSPGVFRVDLSTGASDRIVAPQKGVRTWYADGDGVVRAGLAWAGGRPAMLYRAGEDQRFTRTPQSTSDTPEIEQMVPVRGTAQGYAIAGSAKGRIGLYQYDFGANRLGALIYEHARVDLDGFETDRSGRLVGAIFTEDREQVRWLDPAMRALQRRVDAALPGRANRILASSDPRLLVWSIADGEAGGWFLFDRASGQATLLSNPRAALEGKRLATVRPVRFVARDGLHLGGYLTLPPGRSDKGLPLVVMPHGGPFARDTADYDSWVQFLATRGYAVLQPNFRGSTGFGRNFETLGDGQWGRAMQDDIDDGVAWLARAGTIDPKRVCIMGASFGGYSAMWAAIRNPDQYRCAISYAGVSDIAAQLAFDKPTFDSGKSFRGWQRRIQGDGAFPLDSISPLKQAARIRIPLLIAHGTADETVPFDQSLRLHRALEKLGQPHEFVPYRGEYHSIRVPANEADFLTRVGAFLARHNPA
jgi:dipeptidyl aminopeptidase/acylaminoacyl peptidase